MKYNNDLFSILLRLYIATYTIYRKLYVHNRSYTHTIQYTKIRFKSDDEIEFQKHKNDEKQQLQI